jgi:hypothetical protein
MILEAYIWALSRAAKGARKAGLVYEVAGIAGRYNRQKKAWQPHLENTRRLIADNIHLAQENEPILLLGAGLGLDVPLGVLDKHPTGVLLADAVETPQMRAKLRKHENISLEISDVTGLLAPFWASDTSSDNNGPILSPACAPIPLVGHSMVISCNILSQLPLPFANSPPETDIERKLTAAIQQAHMAALKAMKCPVLLITDYERVDTNDGIEEVIPTAPPQLLPGDPIETWDWHVAPLGELGKTRKVTLNVGAWLMNV